LIVTGATLSNIHIRSVGMDAIVPI